MSEGIFHMNQTELMLHYLEEEYVSMWITVEQIELGRDWGARNSGDAFGRYTKAKYGFDYYEDWQEMRKFCKEHPNES